MNTEETLSEVVNRVEDAIAHKVPEDLITGAGALATNETTTRKLKIGYFNGTTVTKEVLLTARRIQYSDWYAVVVSRSNDNKITDRPCYGLVHRRTITELRDRVRSIERMAVIQDHL